MSSNNTGIEWTDATWNPTTGCDKISAGCKFCYAEYMAITRLRPAGNPRYVNGFDLTLHRDLINLPRHWRKAKHIFVNSMSDIFHKDIPLEFLQEVFTTMNECPQHRFQVLTKRSDVLLARSSDLTWTENIWMGVSVENQDNVYRIDDLRKVPAHVRFLSLEPLLGPLPELNLEGIHWVIVGGESGPAPRPMDPAWVRDLRDQCQSAQVAFFFKQWSGKRPKTLGRQLDGQEWNEFPATTIPQTSLPEEPGAEDQTVPDSTVEGEHGGLAA